MRRVFGTSLTLVVVALLLTGCGGKSSNNAAAAVTSAPTSTGNGLAALIGKAASKTDLYYEITISTPFATQNVKQWVKMGTPFKLRMEIALPGAGTNITLWDGKKYYTYDPVSKMATEVLSAGPTVNDASSINQYAPVLVGSETVNGIDCAVYQYTVEGTTSKMWISKQDGLTRKTVSETTTKEYKNYNFSAIADSMFQLPSDAIIMGEACP